MDEGHLFFLFLFFVYRYKVCFNDIYVIIVIYIFIIFYRSSAHLRFFYGSNSFEFDPFFLSQLRII